MPALNLPIVLATSWGYQNVIIIIIIPLNGMAGPEGNIVKYAEEWRVGDHSIPLFCGLTVVIRKVLNHVRSNPLLSLKMPHSWSVLLILCNLLNIASGVYVLFCIIYASCHGISLALCFRHSQHSILDTLCLNIMCSLFSDSTSSFF